MESDQDLEYVYDRCLMDCCIHESAEEVTSPDISVNEANEMLEKANLIQKSLTKNSPEWQNVYELNYNALKSLAQALASIDKVKIDNDRCLYAYICLKSTELDLDFPFFERIRAKVENIKEIPINGDDWKQSSFQFKVYISAIKSEIVRRSNKVKMFRI